MKTTNIIISLLLLILANHTGHVYAKNLKQGSISLQDRRNIFVSIGSGFPEFFSSRIGYQINNEWSAAVKLSNYYDGVGGRMYLGTLIGGIKITNYYEPTILSINNISFELGYSKSGNYNNYAFDLSIGNESTRNILLKPFWALSMSFIKTYDNKLYVTPGFKIGINFNF
jgi:hypothetical protein